MNILYKKRGLPTRRRLWASSRLTLAEYYLLCFLMNCEKQLIKYVIKCFDSKSIGSLFQNLMK